MQTLAPAWNLSNTATTKRSARLLPSLNDVAFLLPVVMLFARFDGTELLFADGDTGWHIRTGEWILSHRAVPTVDLFSFSKAGQPWFAWEWAWDLIFALIHRAAGLAGVGFAATLMLASFSWLLYRVSLQFSGNHLASIAATALAAGASSIHWLARPHLFSWIFSLLFLSILLSAKRGSTRGLFLLPVLMVAWTNLHGGFVAGLLIVGCYAAGESVRLVMQGFSAVEAWCGAKAYWRALALCAAATFVNPYGWLLHRHIYAYLTDSELLDKISEFQSISFHAGPAWLFEAGLLLGAFAVFRQLRVLEFAPVLLLCLWAHYALFSARHIPLFMAVAAPFIAEVMDAGLRTGLRIKALFPPLDAVMGMVEDFRSMEAKPGLPFLSAAGVALTALLFAGGAAPFAPRFNPKNFPLQATSLLERHVHSRIFTTDQWSDYLLYRFYPAQRVFFDGRSDFYGNDFIKLNQRIASADHEWKALLGGYAIDLVVLKPDVPLSAVLKLTSGSKVLFDDGKVIIFDIAGIYQPALGGGETARAASSSSLLHGAPGAVAITFNHMNNPMKGKMS